MNFLVDEPLRSAPGYIRAIAPYLPGKPTSELARELGLEESDIVKLASNENPLGVSPSCAGSRADALTDWRVIPTATVLN